MGSLSQAFLSRLKLVPKHEETLSELRRCNDRLLHAVSQRGEVLKALHREALGWPYACVSSDRAGDLSRSVKEQAGYQEAISLVDRSADSLPLTMSTIRRLHALLFPDAPRAGLLKRYDNTVEECKTDGTFRVIVRPTPGLLTLEAMEDLLRHYREAQEIRREDPLLIIPLFFSDFLSIHPFEDGNGRVARLLFILLLHQAGYPIGRYVSMERLINETRSEYYRCLECRNDLWNEDSHDAIPWLEYVWGVLRQGYGEVQQILEGKKPASISCSYAKSPNVRVHRVRPKESVSLPFDPRPSEHLVEWLQAERLSLAATSCRSGRLFLLGIKPSGRLSLFNREVEQPAGLWMGDQALMLATRSQLWWLENMLGSGEISDGRDRFFRPHQSWFTGPLDISDLALDVQARPVFCSARFSCLATVDRRHSFRPLWVPPWISKLEPESRCLLSGMALEEGRPRFVTAAARVDSPGGWQGQRRDGGVIVEVSSGDVVCDGLSMPCSPRLHQGRLWVLNTGAGELGTVDLNCGTFTPVCFLPGFPTGLTLHAEYAVVSLSRTCEGEFGADLPLADRLPSAESRCGIVIVDLPSGRPLHWLEVGGGVNDLKAVGVLPGVRNPAVVSLTGGDFGSVVSCEYEGGILRWRTARKTESHPTGRLPGEA